MSIILLFFVGLASLLVGAELLVRGSSRLALAIGLSPLVIGLTVVAIGTSSPEIAIGIGGALRGNTDLALGNIVGSNIANVLLILGLIAIFSPLAVARQLVRIDVPIMIAVSLLTLWLAWDGGISRLDGLLLLAGAAIYIVFLIRLSRSHPEHAPEPAPSRTASRPRVPLQLVLIVAGLALLVWGADQLVDAATALARAWGMSELVIGLTIIAVGTSMPEIATCVLAAVRGQSDLAVGNIVGTSIFNLLLVLGLTAAVASDGVPVSDALLRFDLPMMVAVAIACLPIFFTGHCIARWEGAVFLLYYAGYVAFLLLAANQHAALDEFGLVMRWVVIPLTLLTLFVSLARALRSRRDRRRQSAA